ncbi:MAG: hypothetical protein QXQ46_09775 [Thermoplasmatales archaeon]
MPRNVYDYCLFISVLRITRDLGIENILDFFFREEYRNAILVLAAVRAIRLLSIDLLHAWYD